MGVLFLLGGSAASLIYAVVSKFANDKTDALQGIPPEAMRGLRQTVWSELWMSTDIGNYLADSPAIIVALFKENLWFVPFITLLIGFDQVCGDMQHRTIRYTAIRARRESILAGKALATWGVVAVMLLGLHAFVWLITLVRGDGTPAEIAAWGPRMWALSVVFAAAYAGLTILVSSLTKRPVISLFLGIIAFAVMWVVDLAAYFTKMPYTNSQASGSQEPSSLEYICYAIPDHYVSWLVTPKAPQMLGAIVVLFAFGVGATALAGWIVNRRDI